MPHIWIFLLRFEDNCWKSWLDARNIPKGLMQWCVKFSGWYGLCHLSLSYGQKLIKGRMKWLFYNVCTVLHAALQAGGVVSSLLAQGDLLAHVSKCLLPARNQVARRLILNFWTSKMSPLTFEPTPRYIEIKCFFFNLLWSSQVTLTPTRKRPRCSPACPGLELFSPSCLASRQQ